MQPILSNRCPSWSASDVISSLCIDMYMCGVVALLCMLYLIGALIVADLVRRNLKSYKCEYVWILSMLLRKLGGCISPRTFACLNNLSVSIITVKVLWLYHLTLEAENYCKHGSKLNLRRYIFESVSYSTTNYNIFFSLWSTECG